MNRYTSRLTISRTIRLSGSCRSLLGSDFKEKGGSRQSNIGVLVGRRYDETRAGRLRSQKPSIETNEGPRYVFAVCRRASVRIENQQHPIPNDEHEHHDRRPSTKIEKRKQSTAKFKNRCNKLTIPFLLSDHLAIICVTGEQPNLFDDYEISFQE